MKEKSSGAAFGCRWGRRADRLGVSGCASLCAGVSAGFVLAYYVWKCAEKLTKLPSRPAAAAGVAGKGLQLRAACPCIYVTFTWEMNEHTRRVHARHFCFL